MKRAAGLLIACVGALLTLGTVMLYSAVMYSEAMRVLEKQILWCVLGLAMSVALAQIDYRRLRGGVWVVYGGAIVLLALVLHPDFGTRVNGARRWLLVGGTSVQPSEFGKLALILMLAWYGERFKRRMPSFWKGFVIPVMIILPVLALVFREPDRGTTILLAAVSVGLLLVAGTRWRFMLPGLLLGGAGLVYSLLSDPVRHLRIQAWLDPEKFRVGVGYQVWQSLLALGSGGVDGLGLGNGRQKLGFLPLDQTDFIFSLVGEELGLVATLAVVLIFVLLVLAGVYIAWHARDNFGFLLGSGISFLIGLQAFINIAVVTNLLPNKGLPLPFVSYGGSNLIVMLASVGILISIARHSEEEPTVMPAVLDSQPMVAA